MREYLEKNYSPEAVKTRDSTTVLAIKALLEVVQSGSKNMEVAVIEKGKTLEVKLTALLVYNFSKDSPFLPHPQNLNFIHVNCSLGLSKYNLQSTNAV